MNEDCKGVSNWDVFSKEEGNISGPREMCCKITIYRYKEDIA